MNQPSFKKIPLENVKGKLKEQIEVIVKSEILSESVKNIISVTCFSDVYSIPAKEGYFEYKGKAIFFIAYEDQNGNIKKCEKTTEFDGTMQSASVKETCSINVLTYCSGVEVDSSGINVSLKCKVTLEATVYNVDTYECLENGTDIICRQKETSFLIGHGKKEITYPIIEEFNLSHRVCEVISQNATCVITNAQCGVGSVIVDGEVYLSQILLQSEEKKDIIKESRVLPFRIELDYEEAMPAYKALFSAKVRAFKSDVTVEEDNSIVKCQITLLLFGEAYSENTFMLSDDVFSKTENLEIKHGEIEYKNKLEHRCIRKSATLNAILIEALETDKVIGTTHERIEIISKEKDGQKLNVTGVLFAGVIVKRESGELKTFSANFPLDLSFDVTGEDFDEFDLTIICDKTVASLSSDNQIELTTELIATVCPVKIENINYVKEVSAISEKQVEDFAISVFIPLEGEDLWSIAKRINQSPEEIMVSNKDLNFPLSGNERIVVFRQK